MVAASWATMHPEEAGPMAQTISVRGIGIAKLVFHVVGMDDSMRARHYGQWQGGIGNEHA
jgi:hypothetical protein